MDAALLLQHHAFVTAVARALLRDENDVEDVVQETFAAALDAPPPRTKRIGPWLAAIARNRVRDLQRARVRRLRREAAVAKPESTADSTDKLRWQQRVVEQVLALAPPYRDVIVLRYYEELPPRAIAERLDLPVNTVRTRTRRALAQMRGAFDRSYGRAAWTGALALFFLPKAAVAGKLVVAGLVALVAGTAWIGREASRGDSAPAARRSAQRPATASASPATAATGRTEASVGAKRAEPTIFRGQLLDFDEANHPPLAHADVYLQPSQNGGVIHIARTDEQGMFSFEWQSKWPKPRYGTRRPPLLIASRNGLWSDPNSMNANGFGTVMRLPVQLLANPRFQFVHRKAERSVPGVRVSLHTIPNRERPWLPPAFAEGSTDERGFVSMEWPTYRGRAWMRATIPNGDVMQWPLSQVGARTYDPYEIAIDVDEVVHVTTRVLEADGETGAAGASVYIEGGWDPDGEHFRAHGQPLIGKTGPDGRVSFRFPDVDARRGWYVPSCMLAFRGSAYALRGGPHGRTSRPGEPARSGGSLPLLRLGEVESSYPTLAMRSTKTAFLIARDTAERLRGDRLARLFQLRDTIIVSTQGDNGDFGPLLSVVVLDRAGFRWATANRLPLRFGDPIPKQEVEVRSDRDIYVSLACDSLPFETSNWISAGRPRTFEIPSGSRSWTIRRARHTRELLARFDPAKTTVIELD